MGKFCIGLDIGREGAAVLLNDKAAVFVCAWDQHVVRKKKVYRMRYASTQEEQPRVFDHLVNGWGLGEAIYGIVAAHCMVAKGRIHVIAEDVYLGVNPRTSIELAKFGGAIVSRIEPFDPEKQALWVKPSIWRAPILKLKHTTKRDIAKAASVAAMPGLVDGLPDLLAKLNNAGMEHVCDAAGIASYGILYAG